MAVSLRSDRSPVDTVSPIRVLIVDDSAVARAALTRIVSEAQAFEVVDAVDSARRAIERLASVTVDIVLLDIQMPGLDGLAALPELIVRSNGAKILIVSTLAGAGARATLKALALGAADTLAKPEVGAFGQHFNLALIQKMLRLGKVTPPDVAVLPVSEAIRPAPDTALSCVAIGASTGGLHALAALFGALPSEFDLPFLITQHLPASFMPFFAEQIATLSGRYTRVASEGMLVEANTIIVAPGDRHLGIVRHGNATAVQLLDHATISRCCPSVDPMLNSVAELFGERALAIILSGMGRDGENGAAAIVRNGGTVIVQDSDSSAVWGMPGTIARAGLASLIAAPADLALYASSRCVAK